MTEEVKPTVVFIWLKLYGDIGNASMINLIFTW